MVATDWQIPLIIRDEEARDAQPICELLQAAFESPIEAAIVEKLRVTCPERVSLVAVNDHRIVGHILFTPVTIETTEREIRGFGLAPMAVLPESQRTGIGSALVRSGIERLQESHCPFVVVVGHPEYYPRFGFVPASRYGVRCEWAGVPGEAFMILVLRPDVAPRLAGLARYRPEFAETV